MEYIITRLPLVSEAILILTIGIISNCLLQRSSMMNTLNSLGKGMKRIEKKKRSGTEIICPICANVIRANLPPE